MPAKRRRRRHHRSNRPLPPIVSCERPRLPSGKLIQEACGAYCNRHSRRHWEPTRRPSRRRYSRGVGSGRNRSLPLWRHHHIASSADARAALPMGDGNFSAGCRGVLRLHDGRSGKGYRSNSRRLAQMTAALDASPLCYLVLIGEIEFLPQLFSRVVVPQTVILELRHEEAPEVVRIWANNLPPWISVMETPEGIPAGMEKLQAGERRNLSRGVNQRRYHPHRREGCPPSRRGTRSVRYWCFRRNRGGGNKRLGGSYASRSHVGAIRPTVEGTILPAKAGWSSAAATGFLPNSLKPRSAGNASMASHRRHAKPEGLLAPAPNRHRLSESDEVAYHHLGGRP